MAIAPASVPLPAAAPAAAQAPGGPASQPDDAIAQTTEFARLLATGLEEIPDGKSALKALLRTDDPPADGSDLQGAVQTTAEPPVVAFMLASLNHPAPPPAPADTSRALPAGQDAMAGARAAPGKPLALSTEFVNPAREKAMISSGDAQARELASSNAKGGRAADISSADALVAAAPPGPMHALATAHGQPLPEPVGSAAIGAPVGAPGWGEELGHRLVWMAGNGEQVASLRLNPPDLGPVEIRITLSGEQGNQATVQFASAHASVRDAIQAAIPSLHSMLADSGIRLDQSAVSSESFRDQSAAGDRNGSGGAASRHQASAAAPDPAPLHVRTGGNSLVDTFA